LRVLTRYYPADWGADKDRRVEDGPQVGQVVPDFRLSDQNGKLWTRASIMGPKGALLLFYRSADWCPYCKTQLVDLQRKVDQLRAQGLGVAAISYDPVPILAEFATRRQITFPLLSDAGSATIKAFGILNPLPEMAFGPDKDDPQVMAELRKYVSGGRPNPSWAGIAFLGTFILDPQGRVKSRFFEDYYVERTRSRTSCFKWRNVPFLGRFDDHAARS
jgi:peroxiredoxin